MKYIETLVNPAVKMYPQNGKDFLIIQPHFNDYEDHIEIVEGHLIAGYFRLQ